LQGPGENAGVIDLGDGEAVCFKVESHNHPSAVEPFQGAATGVGGILRDIIAMGARPIALLNGLRFSPGDARFDRAVAGIGAYGNSVGVPTVGGEAVFDAAYRDNVLVNAMCVGLLPADRIATAGATGPGNFVVVYGATTGRDGIGGASVLASQELGEDDADKRPTVQVGDPFTGKKLIEVSVELVESGLVESLQDCGAAGLASSLSEMARECGIDLRLDQVPLREEGMEPWEVMISESQERMVAVVRPQMLADVQALCDRWELHHAVVGEVTDTGLLRAFWEDEVVGEIPARLLTDECPRYRVEPQPRRDSCSEQQSPLAAPAHAQALVELLGSDNLRSRADVYQRYDHLVGSRTVRRPGLDAAVLRLRPGYRGLAVSLDGSGRMGRLDPRTGGRLAVLEAARNVACTGAQPLGLTDCLNFGNPEKGPIAWELVESIEGMAEACEALGIPIVSGNVSLYNETDGRAIDPTPVVGCVGLIEDVRGVPGAWREGDVVLLAGASPVALAGSEYQARYGEVSGTPARLDLEAEAALIHFLHRAGPHCSLLHDVSLGGLAVALAKAGLHSGVGAELRLPDDPRAWFGEGGGQAVLACPPEVAQTLGGVPTRRLGFVGGDSLLGVGLDELREAWA
jgi:phosphoribosylformylglycinamidine synthase